jgi:germination protein M
MRRLTAGLACFGLLWALAGCAASSGGHGLVAAYPVASTTTGPPASRSAATVKQRGAHLSGKQLKLAVYYVRSFGGRRYLAPEWHPVPYTKAVATAAVGELLGGQPLSRESRRPFPAGARLRSMQIEAGTAIVDLTGQTFRAPPGPGRRWPLQALVHTVTQFPAVERVVVKVEGRPLGGPLVRDPALPLAPIALIEPAPGALVEGARVVVRGEASVYEGTVSLRLRDDGGRVMAQSYATSATGAPGRGPFSGALTFTPPASSHCWTLEAFEVSPEDGEVVYSVQLPVWVGR